MKRNARTMFLLLSMAASWASAAVAAPLTADDAAKLALAKNSLVVGADASVVDARSGLYGSYSRILPQISAQWSRSASAQTQLRGTQAFSGLVFPTPRQDFIGYTNTPVLRGSWNFLDLSAIEGYSSARSGLHSAELAARSTRQLVALDARSKFYEVVKAIHLARVSSQALKLSRDDEKRVQALFAVGSVSRSDLLKAQVRTAQSQLDSILKQNAIVVTRITLAMALGIEEGKMGEVDTVLTAVAQPYDENQILAEAVMARPDLQAAKAEWDAARAGVRAANFSRLPFLFINGSVQYRPVSRSKTTVYDSTDGSALPEPLKENTRSDVDRVYSAAIGLTWNIFTGFGTESEIATSKARLMRAKDSYDVVQRNLASEVHQALITYSQVVDAYSVTQSAIESARENMKLTQQKYNVGSATILDLIDAQVQLQSAESDAVSALAAMRVAEATVEKVRGRGD